MAAEAGPSFKDGECTYETTKRKYVQQKWYNCKTCRASPSYGCCEECAKVCHKGHELSEIRDSNFYCDCGSGSLLTHPAKCEIMPPFDWVKWTQERLDNFMPALQDKLTELMGKPLQMEIDWDSFRAAASPESTFNNLRYRWGTFERAVNVFTKLVKFNGTDKLGALEKITWVHSNEGAAPDDRFSVDGKELKLTCSYCCWWHQWRESDLSLFLSIEFNLVEGFKKVLTEAAAEASEKQLAGVVVEIDFDSFNYDEEETEKKNFARSIKAYERASNWNANQSVRPITDAFRWTNSSYPGGEDVEIQGAFTKFVIHNRHWKKGDRREHKDEGKYVKYFFDTKELHYWSPFENHYYWDNIQYYDIREITSGVMWAYRLGEFETMNVQQHEWKMQVLKNACSGWLVRSGDFNYLKDLLRFPAFAPKDNHERHAFKHCMAFVNGADYRQTIPEDTREAEKAALARHGLPLDSPEKFIAGWYTTKVNYMGMKQNRLLFVTDRATYTATPAWNAAPDAKRFHRFSHEHFQYTQAGEIVYEKSGGLPSVTGGPSLPGVPGLPGLPNAPAIPGAAAVKSAASAVGGAAGAVGGAVADGAKAVGGVAGDAAKATGEALGVSKLGLPTVPGGEQMPNAPQNAFKLWTDRLAADDKPKTSFKMPEIPDLKEKLLGALKQMIETLKSISMPSLPELPGMPTFSLSDIMKMVSKCKPKRPSLPSMPDMPSTPDKPDGPGARTEWSCASGSFPNESQEDMPKVNEAIEQSGSDRIKLPMPELSVTGMLEKIVAKLEAAGEFVLDIPSKFGLVDLLKHLGRTIGKTTGLDGLEMPSMPELSPVAALTMVKDGAKDLGAGVIEMIDKMIEGAKDLCPLSLPKLPNLGIKRALQACIDVLKSIELPSFDVDFAKFLPGLPNLPLPALPGAPAMPKVELNKGPVEPEELETVHLPVIPNECKGASNYAAQEMAQVIYAVAYAYNRGERWPSSPSTGTVTNGTCTTAGIYNSTPFGGFFGVRTGAKPSTDPGPLEDGEL